MTKPLPKIAKCACGRKACLQFWEQHRHNVTCVCRNCWIGPDKLTPREAIKAWNRVMGAGEDK